jgi:cysteine desulfurase
VASNLNVSFGEVRGDAFLSAVPELALSGGAACASGKADASHVLEALGVPAPQAQSAIRIAIGRMTTAEEVDDAATMLVAAARRMCG